MLPGYPLFLLMSQGGLQSVFLGHVALGVLLALFISVNMTVLVELLPTRVRVGGFSIVSSTCRRWASYRSVQRTFSILTAISQPLLS